MQVTVVGSILSRKNMKIPKRLHLLSESGTVTPLVWKVVVRIFSEEQIRI